MNEMKLEAVSVWLRAETTLKGKLTTGQIEEKKPSSNYEEDVFQPGRVEFNLSSRFMV